MKKTEFREALAALNVTQGQAAKFLGYSLRQIHGYANGDAIPAAVAHLLRLMVIMRLTIADVLGQEP